ncbi:flagellar biosynthetic protein FliO [Nitrincola iocasae]|jgi:flagellar protein FliO/FliZ|uniref:Flagellar protein n=2 Tax=Nitrincola iocasae TaxID=2614693 RepID=A0A5J6LAC9_9GAMM|nr:flagellar biosynthetic protein FliO [Nitrincola iocasae]
MNRLVLCLLFVSPAAFAESGLQSAPTFAYSGGDPMSITSVLQLVLGLALVLGTIFLIAWLLRKVTLLPGQHRKLRVVAALSLGNRERAVLVQVGDEQLLLGVAQGQVSLLKSFDQPVIELESGQNSAFSKKLSQYLQKRSE